MKKITRLLYLVTFTMFLFTSCAKAEVEVCENTQVNSVEEVCESTQMNSVEEVCESTQMNSVEEVCESTQVNSVEEVCESTQMNSVEEVCESTQVNSIEEVCESIQVNSVEEVCESTQMNSVEEVCESTQMNSVEEVCESIQVNSIEKGKIRHTQETEHQRERKQVSKQTKPPANPYDFTICFAGDINLDENWCTTQYLNQCENGIHDCISQELIEHMQQADVMCLNNEFTYSTQGAPLEGKMYTFRAKPERVEVLKELGVDIVKLANNHVYDYGEEALLDTFATLEAAGIGYIGAGKNLKEAMTPVYIELDGKTIAFVAASRAEKYKMTPQATESTSGILRCYDTELLKQVITEADQNADFVIAYVHWGTEYSYELEKVQLTTGKEYLDAGADVIIGAHSHCLQGMEYYDGKPIAYSLGNYWFNEKTLDTMLLDLHFYGNDEEQNLEVKVIPAVQSNYTTTFVKTREEQERIYSFLEDISVNVDITEDGVVVEKEKVR